MNQILTWIALFFSFALSVLWKFFKLISPLLIVFIIYMVGKIIYEHFKYGKTLNPFRSRKNVVNDKQKMTYTMLAKMPGERTIFRLKNVTADLIMVDETGIYLIYILKYTGIIMGKKENVDLKEQIGLNQIRSIPNFLHPILHDEHLIENLNLLFETWIVMHNACIYKITPEKHHTVLHNKEFFYKMQSHLKQKKKIYNKEQIKEITNLLEKRLG